MLVYGASTAYRLLLSLFTSGNSHSLSAPKQNSRSVESAPRTASSASLSLPSNIRIRGRIASALTKQKVLLTKQLPLWTSQKAAPACEPHNQLGFLDFLKETEFCDN